MIQKNSKYKTSWPFPNHEDYEGDTNENNSYTDDSRTENDNCVSKLGTEEENEYNKECK